MYGFLKGQPSEDEENAAFIHSDRDYGAIPAHDDPATSHSEAVMPIDMSAINGHCYDTNDWDSLAQRKRERLQRRHTSRRKLANRLSSLVLGSGLDRLASQDNPDLVLPALDPSAQEVMASAPSQASLDQWFNTRSNINFSTIRQNYRATHTQLHMGKPESPGFFRRIKQYIYYDTCMATIKKTMYANSTIILFVKADVMVDLLLCFLYLIDMKQEVSVNLDPPWLYKWRSYDLWLCCRILSIWNLSSYLMRVYMTIHPLSVFLSFRFLIELFTTIPFLISNFLEHGQFLYVPYFLRSWVLLLRIKSALKIKMNLQITDKPVDALNTKLVYLVGMLIVLLYNGVSAFQYCEVTFANINYSILDSLYVVMVTLSTVGYGDITPRTEGSRVVMMLLIVISLAVLPGLLTDVMSTLRKRREGGGCVSKGAMPFILIVGVFRPDQVNDILEGFLNRENKEAYLNVVFLDINSPNEELKFYERNSIWGHRVQFLHGSALNIETLKRVRARYAKAIFTMADHYAADPAKEDERNTVRLWSLYCYTVGYNVPIYSYNLSPDTAVYQKMAKQIICVREFKQYLLAMNCCCRGSSTLLTNLLHQRQPMNRYDEPWQAQYDDGSCNEIYIAPPPACLVGLHFGHAALIVFRECQVILFAIKRQHKREGSEEIMLNPGNHYIIKDTDLCVYMAESPSEIKDINQLKPSYVQHARQALENASDMSGETLSAKLQVPNKLKKKFTVGAGSQHPSPCPTSRSRASSISSSTVSTAGHSGRFPYQLSYLPTSRHALMTGSSSIVGQLSDGTPVDRERLGCYLLDHPVTLDDVTLENADGMEDHILVCLHRRFTNIFKFIYNLRSPHLAPEELQEIVLLCTVPPTPKMFELLDRFPKVYYMMGDCRRPDDLLRAGVKRARQVVVMSEKECLEQYEKSSDSPAIMASHIMELLLKNNVNRGFRIVNLVDKSNIKFMHLLQGKDVAEEIDVLYAPAYAAGDVVVDSLISNALLSQTYFKPDMVSIIKALCGIPGSWSHRSCHKALSNTPYLQSVPMPDAFVGSTFAQLFEAFLLDYEVLPIGLLRAPGEELGNELPFVYTNPVPSLILKETDAIFVLASPDNVSKHF